MTAVLFIPHNFLLGRGKSRNHGFLPSDAILELKMVQALISETNQQGSYRMNPVKGKPFAFSLQGVSSGDSPRPRGMVLAGMLFNSRLACFVCVDICKGFHMSSCTEREEDMNDYC